MDPYANYTNFLDIKIRPGDQETMKDGQEGEEDDDDDENGSPEIETLPLFPMHGEDIHGYCNLRSDSSYYGGGWYHHHSDEYAFKNFNNGSHRTSLELTLNSYTRRSPDST